MTLENLGKYELLAFIGSGSTADVYRAKDSVLGRDVALKILKSALLADSSLFARFVQEAQAASKLFHPNIATVLDMGEANGKYYIALRYIDGFALDQYLQENGPLPINQAIKILEDIGGALDYAHKSGFLHRDVKPSNIIRSREGEFVLTDFGLLRAMVGTGLTSHTGAILGTPPYIAPEVWKGEEASAATDQYALACVMYEALTGRVLFAGDSPFVIMRRHTVDVPDLKTGWPATLDPKVSNLITIALAMEPEDRFPKLASFVDELKSYQQSPTGYGRKLVETPVQDPSKEQIVKPVQEVQVQSGHLKKATPRTFRSKYWMFTIGALFLLVIGLVFFHNQLPGLFFGQKATVTPTSMFVQNMNAEATAQSVQATLQVLIMQSSATIQAKQVSTSEIGQTQISLPSATLALILTPEPSATFTSYQVNIQANQRWMGTGIDINTGDVIQFSAGGQWSNNQERVEMFGPDGHDEYQQQALLPRERIGALVGRVGTTGESFLIGSGGAHQAQFSGILQLSMNDSLFRDNAGSVTVWITIRPKTP